MVEPDIHMLRTKAGPWLPIRDTVEVFERAGRKEIKLVYRQKTHTIVGRPRYIYYWKEV